LVNGACYSYRTEDEKKSSEIWLVAYWKKKHSLQIVNPIVFESAPPSEKATFFIWETSMADCKLETCQLPALNSHVLLFSRAGGNRVIWC
jgi:hypothetical protein